MNNNALHSKDKKYFFTENIFDDDYVEEAPPPTFSGQELESTRQKALAEGRQLGLKESETSQLKQTQQILDKIQKQLAQLGASESLREKIFEKETLELCLAIFEKLFPLYNEHAGFEELKQSLAAIMQKQEGQNHVVVTVTPDVSAAIETHLNSLKNSGFDLKFTVKGDESLAPGSCRLAWNSGGAILNPQAVADEIRASIQQVLAKKGSKGHDGSKTGLDGDAS